MESKDLFQLFVSLPALVINILALVVLLKSRKLPYQIRILSLIPAVRIVSLVYSYV